MKQNLSPKASQSLHKLALCQAPCTWPVDPVCPFSCPPEPWEESKAPQPRLACRASFSDGLCHLFTAGKMTAPVLGDK